MKIFTIIQTRIGNRRSKPAPGGCSGGPGLHRENGALLRRQAFIAAINSANASGGATINLAAGCTYAADHRQQPQPHARRSGMPAVTGPIIVNGFRTTIAGNNSTFRIFLVTSTGNLTLRA